MGKEKAVDLQLEGDPELVGTSSGSGYLSEEGDTEEAEISSAEATSRLSPIENNSCRSKANLKDGWEEGQEAKKNVSTNSIQEDHSESNVPVAPSTASTSQTAKPKRNIRRNAIYHFYEDWPVNSDGNAGNVGDKHYRCYHGNHKIFTISKAGNYNVHTMVGHIRTNFKAIHELFLS
ncbi:hypothetical protein GALMADRAFT_144480 [Galerina marginata CBS 339.88]|uniref:Uncharacterized protein n=1 Tax=Galerina marginata (strain CBS 339.88) TaxID=685588 RepID=A0A067SI51_GALM3|nr:hypothetical protein GALMADRAFT_144480 [Galerina marginata CBS 339.88]